jgi:hypothetical protein
MRFALHLDHFIEDIVCVEKVIANMLSAHYLASNVKNGNLCECILVGLSIYYLDKMLTK